MRTKGFAIQVLDLAEIRFLTRPDVVEAWSGSLHEARNLPASERPFGLKTQLFVERLALRSGVQLDATDAAPAQIFQAAGQRSTSDSPSAEIGMDQEHANPSQLAAIASGGDGAGGRTVPLCDEATWSRGDSRTRSRR